MIEDRESLVRRNLSALTSAGERRDFLRVVCAGDSALLNSLIDTVTQPETGACAETWPVLGAGEVLAERFEIRGALGAGGMGVVYEAIDRKLASRRALKFGRPGHFSRIAHEARSALSITHENICRIYEVHSAGAEDGPTDFISMELVEGETLSACLRRGPVSRADTLDFARQLCRGVEAAHHAGILHLDLKSSNIMLEPGPGGKTRLVIMDFGLALPLAEAGDFASLAGTPHYIAPERWRGAEPAPSADIYAMGVVLYELLTGERPFPDGTPWATRMTSLPQRPSRSDRAPDIRWDAIVLRCLEPEPSRRIQSAAELLASIEKTFGEKTRRWWIAAAIAVSAIAPMLAFRQNIWPEPVGRLALLPLEGTSGNQLVDQGVRGAFYDLGKRLASARRLVLLPFEDTVRNSVNSPQMAASRLGATHVLTVVLAPRPAGFTLTAEVRDIHHGASLQRFQGEFPAQDLPDLATPLAGVITSAFHLRDAPRLQISPAAYARYSAGLSSLNAVPPDVDRALELFQEALRLDPNAVPALTGLSLAYLEKRRGNQDPEPLQQARSAAQRAQSLEPDSVQALIVVAAVENAEGHPERALEHFRRAAELEPESWDVWRRTGLELQELGREEEALEALHRSIQLAPGYYLPHFDLGRTYFRQGRAQDAVREFTAVTSFAPGLAEGFFSLGAALVLAERDAEAERALRESIRLQPTRSALNNLAVLLRVQGRNREAIPLFQQALAADGQDAALRLNLGNALAASGETAAAREQWQKAGEIARGVLRRNPRDAAARARSGYSMVRLGEIDLGADEAAQAAQLAPSDYSVIFWTVMALEAAGRRDEIFPLLGAATPDRLRNLQRQPELAGLIKDPRFIALHPQAEKQHTRKGN